MKVLMLIEHDNRTLKPVNFHTINAAMQLGDAIDVLVIGDHCEAVVQQAATLPSVSRIWVADSSEYTHLLAENVAPLIAKVAIDYDYLIAPATTYGKNLLPRVAALLDKAMISDVVTIISPDTFVRPIYAGNALATMQTKETIKILTIRATAFSATHQTNTFTPVIEKIQTSFQNALSHFESHELTVSDRPELTAARIIISGGRGLKSADHFKLLEALADSIGAAIGASRAAVDAGFAPNDYQVGQTGKIVAPDLYIAIGISGAIQHLAGMKDSKIIVAINNDPDAPIFQVADYSLVADLFTVLPQLQAEFNNIRK